MKQHYVENTKYEIMTPFGWEDFKGVVETEGHHDMVTIHTDSKRITTTLDHKLYNTSTGERVRSGEVSLGDTIHTIDGEEVVTDLTHRTNDVVYDIFYTDTHTITADDVHTSQCDEIAFANQRVSRSMWSSVFPTLSCLHPDTYVLGYQGFSKIKHYFSGEEVAGEYFTYEGEKIYGGYNVLEPLSHGYVSPSSATVKITTESGYHIELTPDHPLCVNTIDDMVPAKDIHKEHTLRCDLNMQVFGHSSYDGSIYDEDEGFPDYALMFNKEGTIQFLKNHNPLFLTDSEALYQVKLMLANLNIISFIIENQLYIHEYSVAEYESIISELLEVNIVDHEIITGYKCFYDAISVVGDGYLKVTYDFTVPNSHAFLQNGIMGSNTGGGCIITSTPSDDETLFAEIWNGANKTIDENGEDTDVGINGFKAFKVKWDQHPERDESYKKLQIAQYGEEKFRREHELEFISMEETLIDPTFLSTYEAIDPIAKTGQIRWYHPLDREKMYFIAYDPSLGTGRDNSAIVIYEFPTLIQVGEWIHNKSDVPTQISVLKTILDQFEAHGFDEDDVYWSLENNSIGEAPLVLIKHEIGEDEFFGTFMKERKKRNNVRVRGDSLLIILLKCLRVVDLRYGLSKVR